MNRLFSIFAVCMVLAGCGLPVSPETFNASPEAVTLRSIVQRLVAKDFASIENQLDPALSGKNMRPELEQVAALLPPDPISKVEAVAWNTVLFTGQPRHTKVVAEYTFGQKQWMVISAELTGQANAYRIYNFNVEPLSAPLSQINAFTLVGKSMTHYIFLIAAVLAVAVSLVAFVQCVRTKGLRRKWLWLLFIALGFVTFTVNWSNGAVHINPFAVNLFSAGVLRMGWLGPWMVTFGLPIGAVWFLLRKRSLRNSLVKDLRE